jgi:putative transposase
MRRAGRHCGSPPQADSFRYSEPVLSRFPAFARFIETEGDAEVLMRLRRAESIGRPLGDQRFIAALETRTNRALEPEKRGRKPRSEADEGQLELNALMP